MTPPDARQVAEQIEYANELEVDREDALARTTAIIADAISEARRQVWEEAVREADDMSCIQLDCGHTLCRAYRAVTRKLQGHLPERARPSEQTETPR